MKHIKLIALLFLIAALTSCGLFKKVSTETHRSQSKTKTDSTYSSTTRDLSKTTITEKVDTVAKTPETRIIAEKPATIDSTGIISAVLDSLMVKVKVSYDKLTNSVSFDVLKRTEDVPVKLDRVTVIEADVKSESKGAVKKQAKSDVKDKVKVSEPKWGVIFTVFSVVILFFVALWLFIKYKIKTVV